MESVSFTRATQAYGAAAALNKGESLVGTDQDSELARALNELDLVRTVIAETRSALSNFLDRMLVGNAPVCAGDEACASDRPYFNDGLTGQIRSTVYATNELATEAMQLAQRLRQIG